MQKLEKKQIKMNSILDVSLPLFAQKGFNGTNVADIAEKAGIGKGTIYEYFNSKEEIFTNLIESWTTKANDNLNELLNDIKDPEEKLKAIFNWNIDWLNSLESDISKIFLEVINQTITEGGVFFNDRVIMDDMCSGIRGKIRDTILEGVSDGIFMPSIAKHAEKISLNISAYLDGTGLYFLMNKPSADEHKELTNHFLKGLLKSLKN